MKSGRRGSTWPEMLGDKPLQGELKPLLESVATGLDKIFNGPVKGHDRKTGFVLLVFPFTELGDGGEHRCNFISNGAARKDVVALMKEMLTRFENQPEPKAADDETH